MIETESMSSLCSRPPVKKSIEHGKRKLTPINTKWSDGRNVLRCMDNLKYSVNRILDEEQDELSPSKKNKGNGLIIMHVLCCTSKTLTHLIKSKCPFFPNIHKLEFLLSRPFKTEMPTRLSTLGNFTRVLQSHIGKLFLPHVRPTRHLPW